MSAEDYFPDLGEVPEFGDDDDEPVKGKVCQYCGQDNLHWRKCDFGWRLFTPHGTMHHCDEALEEMR